MKKLLFIVLTLVLSTNVYSQVRRDRMGNPQVRREPTEQEIEKRQRMIEERKQEYITNFLTTLEADEFQKEIIRQNLNSFYDAKVALLKTPFEHSFDRENAIKQLEKSHFKELKSLISESDMLKIEDMISGEFDEKAVVKEKKKKKKRKRKGQ
ncbi:hypothetical protein [Winogradskyella alexanderae]|uniref:Periplasmic heavy metal sensor n=1 Tax=Winogradskyella alexanderae TaxID=2877123 RepID=A0ABS7XTW6_9FLAO|nr:hypothetical protein [Winogradskyella alexanderae]MCA0133472.1 hypothetical protein [Winogradskyella alexanderae]